MEELQPNLLITDDDRDFRESLGELLTRRGFQTVLADSGEEAIEILQQQSVHLVVVDMHMPRWSGLDTLACLRQMALEVPCILMSPNSMTTSFPEPRNCEPNRCSPSLFQAKSSRRPSATFCKFAMVGNSAKLG